MRRTFRFRMRNCASATARQHSEVTRDVVRWRVVSTKVTVFDLGPATTAKSSGTDVRRPWLAVHELVGTRNRRWLGRRQVGR